MPSIPLRPCPGIGCLARVPKGKCSACQRQVEQRRGSAHARGYDARWRRFVEWFKRKLIAFDIAPQCGAQWRGAPPTGHSACARQGRAEGKVQADHIIPHRGDERLMFDPRNIQLLCASCHSRKTATEDGGFGH